MIDTKQKVVQSIIDRSTSDGAFQRSRIYEGVFTVDKYSKQRNEFRNYLFDELKRLMPNIILNKDYVIHANFIKDFSDKISNSEHNYLLLNKRFRIGTTQKLINLQWKMSWLLLPNYPKPIHCPFDSIVIQMLDRSVRNIKWTSFDDIDTYTKLYNAAKKASEDYNSIAEWELNAYYNKLMS